MTEHRFGKLSRDLIRHGEPIRAGNESMTNMSSNGWSARIDALRKFVNEPGGMAVIVLAILFAMATGWIPSILSRIEAKTDAHQTTLASAIALRTQKDDRLAEILARFVAVIEKQDRRSRIQECAEIKDREVRMRCLE